jgi:hypothetical protein
LSIRVGRFVHPYLVGAAAAAVDSADVVVVVAAVLMDGAFPVLDPWEASAAYPELVDTVEKPHPVLPPTWG